MKQDIARCEKRRAQRIAIDAVRPALRTSDNRGHGAPTTQHFTQSHDDNAHAGAEASMATVMRRDRGEIFRKSAGYQIEVGADVIWQLRNQWLSPVRSVAPSQSDSH
jgi:hypothetical protein